MPTTTSTGTNPTTSTNIYVADKNITGLDILAHEDVIFEVRSSVALMIVQIIGLLALAAVILWVFIHFQVAQKIGLGQYSMWVNAVPLVAVGILVLCVLVNWYATKYILTTERVQMSYSFFAAYDKSITLDKVNSVKYQKNFFGVILNYGTIVMKSAASDFELRFNNISNPKKYLDLINDQLE